MPQLANLFLADEAAPWRQAGFTVVADAVWLGPVGIILGNKSTRRAWAFHGIGAGELDGLETRPAVHGIAAIDHPNGATGVDHVVIASKDLERTTTALAEVDIHLRRTRNLTDGVTQQRFFWAGETILELIGPRTAEIDPGPLSLWGLALVVDDIERAVTLLGERCTSPKAAVQPGRMICAIRTQELGISLPIALMTPHR
ncbi:MAG: glyoxalase [Acidimicrobiales bacterium]|nr:glyoxalase [Acidimicrobiales bacterium]